MKIIKGNAYAAVFCEKNDREILSKLFRTKNFLLEISCFVCSILVTLIVAYHMKSYIIVGIFAGIYVVLSGLFLILFQRKLHKQNKAGNILSEGNEKSEINASAAYYNKFKKICIMDWIYVVTVAVLVSLYVTSFCLTEYFSKNVESKTAVAFFFIAMSLASLVMFLLATVIFFFKQRNFLKNPALIAEYNERAELFGLPLVESFIKTQDYAEFAKSKQDEASELTTNDERDFPDAGGLGENVTEEQNSDNNSTAEDELEKNFFESREYRQKK